MEIPVHCYKVCLFLVLTGKFHLHASPGALWAVNLLSTRRNQVKIFIVPFQNWACLLGVSATHCPITSAFNANSSCVMHSAVWVLWGQMPTSGRHSCANDSCGCGLFRAGSTAISTSPPSQLPLLQGRKEDPSPWLLQLSSCRISLPGPKPEQWRSPAFISARSQLFALHCREPEFHHNLFSTVLILSLASLWPESGTHVTHPHYLFARILSQQAFRVPESGAKIIRFSV